MTHYIIVRRDLPRGLQSAQIVHAAGESSDRVPSGTHAVVLTVPDESALEVLETQLKQRDIPHTSIRESDGEFCAIGIEPVQDRTPVRKVMSNLPLLR